ncbi:hypothetical protein P350_17465 [Burkholderia cepacia JBK9]|nr:hypothetical protein P350_17465 [Burkholderia cepacia JBK9]
MISGSDVTSSAASSARATARGLVPFPLLRRPRLVTKQIHFLGNYSFVIIAVSGLFVGFVLGLQGYYTLNRYGSEQALGLLVALSLVRDLARHVGSAIFVIRRACGPASSRCSPRSSSSAAVTSSVSC